MKRYVTRLIRWFKKESETPPLAETLLAEIAGVFWGIFLFPFGALTITITGAPPPWPFVLVAVATGIIVVSIMGIRFTLMAIWRKRTRGAR